MPGSRGNWFVTGKLSPACWQGSRPEVSPDHRLL
jgi:hypothetical protein